MPIEKIKWYDILNIVKRTIHRKENNMKAWFVWGRNLPRLEIVSISMDKALIDENEEFERFIETHEKYGDTPMYTTLNEYIDNELIVLQLQIENLRLKLQDILNN